MKHSPEWHVTYETRLGMLCEDREPTPRQVEIAMAEADAACKDERRPFGEI